MSSNIYCGSKNVPKNKKLGSMIECAEKGQVSYWGVRKIDPRVLENVKVDRKITLDKARSNKIGLTARLNRLNNAMESTKDADKKKALKKDIEKTKKELDAATKVYQEAFKLSEEKKQKKNTTKKTTKKTTDKTAKKTTKETAKKTTKKTTKKTKETAKKTTRETIKKTTKETAKKSTKK